MGELKQRNVIAGGGFTVYTIGRKLVRAENKS